jgi:hypothetical protein
MWWPQLTGQPAPDIPSNALELVTRFDDAGKKLESEFWLRGRRVGRAAWYESGHLAVAVGLRRGIAVGPHVEYHDAPGGPVSYAEPYVDGKVHGLAKQFDADGRLILVSPFVRGTGTDYWCDETGQLAEEHPVVRGKLSGRERWWNPDGKSVFAETQYRDGVRHGVAREWLGGKLRPGFPKFFVAGKERSKRQYLEAAKANASIPLYRPEENNCRRRLPEEFIELKRRAARLRPPGTPTPVRKFRRPISEEPVVLGKVIAERRYQVGAEWILLQIGTPHRASWRSDFYCPVRIVGRETKLLRAFGIDSVQALLLAFELARATLGAMKPAVYWFAGERLGDVGIEKRIFTGLGMDADKKAEDLIDRLAADMGREFEKRRRKSMRP